MSTWRHELGVQARLALPVVAIQLGLVAMGVVDSMFLGRVSAEAFAATTLGNSWSFQWLALGFGILHALDPIASQAFGARDDDAIARGLQRGVVLALVLSPLLAVPVLFAEPFFVWLGQPPEVVPDASAYARIATLGFPGFLVFVAARTVLQAMHRLAPLLWVIFWTNLLNVALDWMLIYGNLGFPPMGAVGSAWGTTVARTVMGLAILVVARPQLGRYLRPWRADTLRLEPILRMVRLGLPVGLQFTTEIGAFGLVGYLMGRFGAREIAGHQVAMTLVSTSFMVPLGISIAASVRVGNEIGRGAADGARLAARVALCAGALVMLVSATSFVVFPEPLTRLFTDQEDVLPIALALLPLAAAFQVFDGVQVVGGGVLRGAADTRIPFLAHVTGLWLVGMPLGAWLAFERGVGPAGLWWGLALGLAIASVVLLWRVRWRLGQDLSRWESATPGGAEEAPEESPRERG